MDELPVELPLPIEPLLLPVLGELLLGDEDVLEPLELPLPMVEELPEPLDVPPAAPDEPDLLK